MDLEPFIREKKVLYISTKNLDYIRVTQEIRLLSRQAASLRRIGSRAGSYFFRVLSVYVQLLFTSLKDYDTVFIGFAPQLVLPFWNWKLKKRALLVDFFISCYDTLCCERKRFRALGIPGRFFYWLDKRTLDGADLIVCDTNAHGRYFSHMFSVPRDKLYTLYLEADREIYHPLKRERPQYLKGKFVVLYFGSGLVLQGIDIVLRAMDLLKENKGLHFFLIGPADVKGAGMGKPLSDNIEYVEWVSQERLAEYIDLADLCLAGHFNADVEKAGRVIPGKAFIYRAMGKPMILGDNEANRELFAQSEDVAFVKMGDARALAQKILECGGQEIAADKITDCKSQKKLL